MAVMIQDETICETLIRERRASGCDRYDEVWNGVYVMSPMANNEHQHLATKLAIALTTAIDDKGLGATLAGANVSDRDDDWAKNYRIPDVLVFSTGTTAIDRGSHWMGGPDLAIEVTSPGEQVQEKLSFYASVGTKELLVVDRDPWQLTLYRISKNQILEISGRSIIDPHSTDSQRLLTSEIFPVSFALIAEPPVLRVTDHDNQIIREIAIRR